MVIDGRSMEVIRSRYLETKTTRLGGKERACEAGCFIRETKNEFSDSLYAELSNEQREELRAEFAEYIRTLLIETLDNAGVVREPMGTQGQLIN